MHKKYQDSTSGKVFFPSVYFRGQKSSCHNLISAENRLLTGFQLDTTSSTQSPNPKTMTDSSTKFEFYMMPISVLKATYHCNKQVKHKQQTLLSLWLAGTYRQYGYDHFWRCFQCPISCCIYNSKDICANPQYIQNWKRRKQVTSGRNTSEWYFLVYLF